MSPILPGDILFRHDTDFIVLMFFLSRIARVEYDWDYFKFPDLVKAEMVPYGENTFEFVMVVSRGLVARLSDLLMTFSPIRIAIQP
jgi:hypothetical protein